jgi:hypothetical protein
VEGQEQAVQHLSYDMIEDNFEILWVYAKLMPWKLQRDAIQDELDRIQGVQYLLELCSSYFGSQIWTGWVLGKSNIK